MPLSSLFLTVVLAFQPEPPVLATVREVVKDSKQPFTMLVTFTVKEGQAAAFQKAALTCAAETVKEKGCIAYQLSRDPKKPNSFMLYERWKNLDGLKEHMAMEHTKKLLSGVPDMLDGAIDIKVLEAIEK